MAIEKIRGCGFRKVGGLYLMGDGMSVPCDRLPLNLTVCPVCGQGLKLTTGWTWIQPQQYLKGTHDSCKDEFLCPVCAPSIMGDRAGLLWVGNAFYSPQAFIREALAMGVSKRIAFIPRGLKLGKTWILLAHKKAGTRKVEEIDGTEQKDKLLSRALHIEPCSAIFYAFRPKRIEKLIWKSEATTETILDLEKRGITPVIIPDGDKDHDPSTSVWQDRRLVKERLKGEQQKLESE